MQYKVADFIKWLLGESRALKSVEKGVNFLYFRLY